MLIRVMPVIAGLLACLLAGPTVAQSDPTRNVSGTVSYLQRIALPPEATVVVEARGLRDVILAELRFKSDGAQVPLPFAFDIPAGPGAAIQAAILLDDGVRWLGEAVALPPGTEDVVLDDMILTAYPTGAIPTPMMCGETPILMSFDGEATIIEIVGETLRLLPVMSGSGAKFEMPGDATTFFWSKGENGVLSLLGQEYPECVPTTPADTVYRAGGNEPGWSFVATGNTFTFTTMNGTSLDGAVPAAVWADGAVVWDIADAGMVVRMTDAVCHDTMTGMPHPETVTIETAEGVFTGCGGEPQSLLTGKEWIVEDVGGDGIIDGAHVTMQFTPEGIVSGAGGCNRYTGVYSLSGEGLSFGPAASTMMACAEAMMNLEASFHAALASVARFDIADTGALVLYDAEGNAQITAFPG